MRWWSTWTDFGRQKLVQVHVVNPRPILPKMVWADQIWSTENGPARPVFALDQNFRYRDMQQLIMRMELV